MSSTKPIVAASILASDFSCLREEIARCENAGTDWFHLDVMDGNFVDNISFGPAFCDAARACTQLPLDVHLMIDRPDHYAERFFNAATNITVHVEPSHDVAQTLRTIREGGCTAGLALNPATPLDAVEPFLPQIDLLLVMTVQPGFGGQKFREEMMEKVARAKALRESLGLEFLIEVDGGIDGATGKIARQAGAEVFVAGTYLFKAPDMSAAVASLR